MLLSLRFCFTYVEQMLNKYQANAKFNFLPNATFSVLFWSVFCPSFCSDQFSVLIFFFWKHWHGRRDPGPFSFLSSTWTWRKNHPGRFILQKWKIRNINTSLIAAIFGCGWVNWAQIRSMHQCLPDYHIYPSLVRFFSIILILKIYLTCQNQFEILENSRHRWMRGACCKNIHWSLESLSMSFFRLRFNQQT